jgi:AbrB family looped-hinge helix DNA binding protein
MSTITVSSRYQIVIPAKIREALGIRPGEKLHAFEYRGRIELLPVRPTKAARGSLKGIDPNVPRSAPAFSMPQSSVPEDAGRTGDSLHWGMRVFRTRA